MNNNTTPHMVTLSNHEHRDLKIQTSKVEALGAQQTTIPVVVNEFAKLCVQYPIVFTKHEETGQFVCVAISGFEKGENLFWQDEQWKGVYTPINIMRQPFFIGQQTSDEPPLLCIDTNSPCVSQSEGEALFTEQGESTPFLEKTKATLAHLIHGQTLTQTFIDALTKASVIAPLTLDITLANGSNLSVEGLYSIDEEKLNALPAEELLNLISQGFLHHAHTMLDSLGHIYSLIQLKNERG